MLPQANIPTVFLIDGLKVANLFKDLVSQAIDVGGAHIGEVVSELSKISDRLTELNIGSNPYKPGSLSDFLGEVFKAKGTDLYDFIFPPVTGSSTSSFNLTIDPNLITPKLTTPTDPTSSVSNSNNTLLSGGGFSATGLGNVNTATAFDAWANDIITNNLRPGDFQLVPVSPTQTLSEMIDQAFTAPGPSWTNTLSNAFNNATSGLNLYTPTDPLLLDLNGDGVHLTDYGSYPVLFDIDHDGGSLEQTGWVNAQDGIVVYDLNNNGKIDDISETLSEYFNGAVGSNGNAGIKPFSNGLAALKSLDSNNDNQFTSSDAAWNNVKVWIDANHDGKSFIDSNNNGIFDAGEQTELKALAELGITSINLNGVSQSGLVRDGNEVLATSTFVQNGLSKEALAANFIANPNGSSFTSSGSGFVTTTQGNISSYTAGDGGETVDVAMKGVNNAMGGNGNDTLIGDAGNNWLVGGQGADSLSSGAGDDVLLIDAADTFIDGGDGKDLAQVVGAGGVTLNLSQSHIEAVQGGSGDDFFYGGGNTSVFIRGGDGSDVLIGGAANDVINGENNDDLVDGGAGNDILRGGRGQDQISGGAGDDLIYGGEDDDRLNGGTGNDIISGGQGDDQIDGGDGTDIAQLTGSFADYRITQLNASTYRIVDSKAGRDGADMLTHVEKLNFADVSGVDITLDNPLPVKDAITVSDRIGLKLIKVSDLLANDRDWQGDALHLTSISDIVGGAVAGIYNATTKEWTPTLTANGELQFTPDPTFTGVMSFKYKIADIDNTPGAQIVQIGTSNAAEARGQVFIKTPDMPTDNLFADEWYLNDINILPVWQDYTGKGVRIAQFEPGMSYSTGPEVFNYQHPDLQANVDQTWLSDPNSNIPQTFSDHATLVAGVMVAARNGQGAVGVAYDAKLSGHYIQGTGLEISSLEQEITNALATFKNYDVVNNSWGATADFEINVLPVGLLQTGILDAVQNGRNGLGTAIVMAGGNDRQNGGNTNTNALSANRAVITTGAINAAGDISTLSIGQTPFSNPGASILVSAPGSNIASTSNILLSDDGTIFGSDTSTSQGTSFATPIVSGIVALMLQANPNLGWRDIQQILALSARKVNDPNTDTVWNGANNWNGGGMHTSNDYGFGDVDAHAAVRLAETWSGLHTSDNERHLSNGEGSLNAAAGLGIAINDGAVISRTLTIGAGIRAEHVDISLDVTHSNWGDLTVELISPSGTISKLVSNPGTSAANPGGDAGTGQLTFTFDTTHSYGENAQGNWQLRITDRSGRGVGVLNGWKVDVYGSDYNETANSMDNVPGVAPVISATADNTYYYTDEFAAAPGASRTILNDANGGTDIVNASAVSTASSINLNNGSTSTIAGRNLVVSGDIEYAFGGDGNDVITGNALSNRLSGGRGGDNLNGGDGVDLLDGGQGNDTLTGGNGLDFFLIRQNLNGVDTITDFSPATVGEKIMLVGFDNITDFSQILVTQEGVNTRLGLGGGQSVLLQNLAPTQISEQNFIFFSDAQMLENYISYVATNPNVWNGDANVQNTLLPNAYGDLRAFALGGNDLVGAQTKNDMIDGGDGNDNIWGDYPGYTPIPGNDWLEGGSGDDTLYGGAGNDMLQGGSGNDNLQGEANDDTLRGGAGADQLFGGDGNDVLSGGAGSDYLDGGTGNDLISLEGDLGTISGGNYQYYGTRVGGGGADLFKVTANGGANFGFSAAGTTFSAYNLIADFDPNQTGELIDLTDLTWIRGFNDLSIGTLILSGTPITLISASDGIHQLGLNLYGVNSAAINAGDFKFASVPGLVFGEAGNDQLVGDAGANILDGGAGADSMTGRTGDDTYIVDSIGDTVNELPGGGYDTVKASVTYTLSSEVENLELTGAGNNNGTGNELANRIAGNMGNNVLDGGIGVDTLLGGAGNDTYIVDIGADSIIENNGEGTDTIQSTVSYTLGNNIENLTLTGINDINATGNTLGNTLIGNTGDNMLDGAEGADNMAGGAGNDSYFVDNAGDVVTENLNEGIDTEYAAINTTLSANLENLVLGIAATTGAGNALDNRITGNALNNTLTGNAGNDWLDGGTGNDILIGGAGDDTYVVDTSGDIVTENAAEGSDTVLSAIDYSLGLNLENLTLTGTTAINATGNVQDNILMGNAANNSLAGSAGNDWLDGADGNDVMIGGTGNDTYIVDQSGDVVTENTNEGTDTVQSSINYSLGSNLENLTLTGFDAINAIGNTLSNVLIGNIADNSLDGGTGTDTMLGGGGNDTYTVDNSGDVVTENLNEGLDLINSSVSYTLSANVENLTLTGTTAINAGGNSLNNLLTGNSGNNSLDGGAGVDTLVGGAGNDTYIVDLITTGTGATAAAALEDTVTETGTTVNGIDTLQLRGSSANTSATTLTLATDLENLDASTTGTSLLNLTGNASANILTGNAAANSLNGGAGADTMVGGLGNDTYTVDNVGDVVTENAGEGTDLVYSSINYTLAVNVENLTLTGTASLNATGNALGNVLSGNTAANILTSGDGNDTYVVDLITAGTGATAVAALHDTVIETGGTAGGIDTLQLSGSSANAVATTLMLDANLENLNAGNTGTSLLNLTGNAAANVLSGNAADNTLAGGVGNDSLSGGNGNDKLYGYDVLDSTGATLVNQLVITAKADLLADAVAAKMDVYIDGILKTSFNVANTSAYQTYTVDPALLGIGGHRVQVAFSNDAYLPGPPVQDRNLRVSGISVNGVFTAATAGGVYLDTGTGAAALDGVGLAAGTNILSNNGALSFSLDGNDSLDGGLGTDTLSGGLGDDVYVIDNSADVVIENANAGIDTIKSSFTYDLNSIANIENTTLTGTAAINATGTAGVNLLNGNAADNILDGGNGIDSLVGGAGNDTYIVDLVTNGNVAALQDSIYESSTTTNGIDTLQLRGGSTNNTATTLTLSANLENLDAGNTGNSQLNLTGNASDNRLTGNAANNVLNGGAGNDSLIGGAGNDTLIGGAGNDTYQFGLGSGADLIQENDATIGNNDIVAVIGGIDINQLWFRKLGNDLEMSVIGTGDKTTFSNWYAGSAYHVEQISDGGKTLSDTSIDALVQKMASLSPSVPGQTTLPADYQTALTPILATSWQ